MLAAGFFPVDGLRMLSYVSRQSSRRPCTSPA